MAAIISFETKGDFSKATSFLEKLKETVNLGDLDKYGRQGVEALKAATPRDTGKTAESWYYDIENGTNSVRISFYNSNTIKGGDSYPIALLIQYGHATRNGGFVEGRDYINPAIRPIFDEMAEAAWREVTKL
jgi:hypothetical protein